MKRTEKPKPRSDLPKSRRLYIKGYPREHYNSDKTEKLMYRTEASARRAADHMTRLHGELIEAYHCQYCGAWHIGHRPSLPEEDRIRVLNTTFHNLSSLSNRYRTDINGVARQVLALSEKLDKLEDTLWQKYHELKESGFLLTEPPKEPTQETPTPKQ